MPTKVRSLAPLALLVHLAALPLPAWGKGPTPTLAAPSGWEEITSGSTAAPRVGDDDWELFGPLLARCPLLFAVDGRRRAFLCGGRQPNVEPLDAQRLNVVGELMARAAGGRLGRTSLERVRLRPTGVVEYDAQSGRRPLHMVAWVVCPPPGADAAPACYSIAYGEVGEGRAGEGPAPDPAAARPLPAAVEEAMTAAVVQLVPLPRAPLLAGAGLVIGIVAAAWFALRGRRAR